MKSRIIASVLSSIDNNGLPFVPAKDEIECPSILVI